MNGEKRVRVAGFDYVLDNHEVDIEELVGRIRQAMTEGSAVELPVLDDHGHQLTLFLRGDQTSALVLDLDKGPRPGEISP